MPGTPWTLEVFSTDEGREPFSAFADQLRDVAFAALDAALEHVLGLRGIDLAGTEWLKPLGQGLHEFRVRHSSLEIAHMFAGESSDHIPKSGESVLLRVFVHFHGRRIILLLSGYDKGADPSGRRQQREIAAARKYLTAWEQQQARQNARARKGMLFSGRNLPSHRRLRSGSHRGCPSMVSIP
jgi:putative component of toxin-antitoxin plasmid stabilization module